MIWIEHEDDLYETLGGTHPPYTCTPTLPELANAAFQVEDNNECPYLNCEVS